MIDRKESCTAWRKINDECLTVEQRCGSGSTQINCIWPDPDPLHLAGSGSTLILASDPDPLRFLFPDPDPLKALVWIRVAKQTKTI